MVKITIEFLFFSDAAATEMAVVLSDHSLYTFTGGEPPTADELARRYAIHTRGESSDGAEEWINFVVTLGAGKQPIGYVQATVPRSGGATEIAWVIGTQWQGHGYAKRAVKLLCTYLAERGITHLIAHIHPDHVASQRVAATVGLVPTRQVVDGEVRWDRRE